MSCDKSTSSTLQKLATAFLYISKTRGYLPSQATKVSRFWRRPPHRHDGPTGHARNCDGRCALPQYSSENTFPAQKPGSRSPCGRRTQLLCMRCLDTGQGPFCTTWTRTSAHNAYALDGVHAEALVVVLKERLHFIIVVSPARGLQQHPTRMLVPASRACFFARLFTSSTAHNRRGANVEPRDHPSSWSALIVKDLVEAGAAGTRCLEADLSQQPRYAKRCAKRALREKQSLTIRSTALLVCLI